MRSLTFTTFQPGDMECDKTMLRIRRRGDQSQYRSVEKRSIHLKNYLTYSSASKNRRVLYTKHLKGVLL